MIILDTDSLSLLDRENILESTVVRNSLERFAPEEIFTTIITFEENMRGWLAFIARSKTAEQQIYAYAKLHRFLKSYRETQVVDYDEKAVGVFQDFKAQKIRVGTMDLKIAAVAVSRNAIPVSRNLSDFMQIPKLVVEDWSN